jgi:hypothetical protein
MREQQKYHADEPSTNSNNQNSGSTELEQAGQPLSRREFMKTAAKLIGGVAAAGVVARQAYELPWYFDRVRGLPEAWNNEQHRTWFNNLLAVARQAETAQERALILDALVDAETAYPDLRRYQKQKELIHQLQQRNPLPHGPVSYSSLDDVTGAYSDRLRTTWQVVGPAGLVEAIELAAAFPQPAERQAGFEESISIVACVLFQDEYQNIEPEYARDLVAVLQRRQPTFLRQLQDRYAKEVAAQREHLDWGCILKHTAELFHKHSQSPTNQP